MSEATRESLAIALVIIPIAVAALCLGIWVWIRTSYNVWGRSPSSRGTSDDEVDQRRWAAWIDTYRRRLSLAWRGFAVVGAVLWLAIALLLALA